MRIPAALMPHKVALEARTATNASGGAVLGDPVTVRASVEDGSHLVIDSAGQEVVSATTVYLDLENWVPPESMVTVWLGKPQQRRAKVITVQTFENSFLGNVVLHLE